MFRVNKQNSEEGTSYRITFLRVFAFEIGMHIVNGVHVCTALGIGPCEISLTLHTWEKW